MATVHLLVGLLLAVSCLLPLRAEAVAIYHADGQWVVPFIGPGTVTFTSVGASSFTPAPTTFGNASAARSANLSR
jgi:hypothetical protein